LLINGCSILKGYCKVNGSCRAKSFGKGKNKGPVLPGLINVSYIDSLIELEPVVLYFGCLAECILAAE
jgi:hypothetical protein